ncbi:MAG: PLP-dependent aminotransferase family protein [Acidobacteria bacterium]|nr:PLP-dependent aminotransferase family protein [Acidobacteriota bacterium]
MMPKAAPRQADQSVNGLFRLLGTEPKSLSRARPIYRRIVALLGDGITRGAVPAGHQLPPERDLAAALAISRATVVSAYRELEARGLVRGYVGRGTFVSATPDTASAPFAWRGKIAASALQANETTVRDLVRAASDPRLISVAAGVPALECFPTDAFQRAMTRVLATQADAAWRHGPTEGLQPFRVALADRFGGEPEHILVLAGAQQGLDLLARCLIDPGDAVIIDRPGYLGAIQTFRNAGARLVGWDIVGADTDELEELLLRYRPKLIYTNPTHQNPTGVTMPIRTRRELLELAARYRVPIVEDDTYRDLALTGAPPPPSLFALDEAHTVVIRINSFSKMLAPGLRLGWISAVRPIVEQLALIKQQVDPHTQNLSQMVIAELIAQGVLDKHLATLKSEHRRRRDAMVQALRQRVPAAQLRFGVPDGGMYLWCELPAGIRARAVQDCAVRESLMVLTGDPFYVDQGGDHQLRICYTSQPAARASQIAETLARSLSAAACQGGAPPVRVRMV